MALTTSQIPSPSQLLNGMPQSHDDICRDEKILQMKQKVLGRLKWSALLSNISDATKLIGGMLLTIGTTLAIPAISSAGFAAIPIAATGLLIAGGVALVTAIATGFAATRIVQGGQFDNFEINAQSTARHLVH